jgi:hypothetical protein
MSPMQPQSKWKQFTEKVKYGELLPPQYRGDVLKFTLLSWILIPIMLSLLLFKELLFMSVPLFPVAVYVYYCSQKIWNEHGNKWYIFTLISLIIITAFTFILWLVLKHYIFH